MINRFRKDLPYHAMLLPGVILTFIFSYMPIYGILMAFQNFNPGLGISGSQWVGLENFRLVFSSPQFINAIKNTFVIAFGKISIQIFSSVVFALLLNELRFTAAKRLYQTIVYIPNFISWVIMAGILINLLSSEGLVNTMLKSVGLKPVQFLSNRGVFPWTMIITDVWKTFGFGTVVYLASITSIDPELYESAVIDGAGRWKQTRYVTIPMLYPIITLMSVLALGNVLNMGFDQIYNLYSPAVYVTGDIIETFVYRLGLQTLKYSMGTAVGLFKSVVSCTMISASLYIAYKFANYRVF